MKPKFSIIIPVYNVAPYLRECLDSVLKQTFTDWEAICVDDGSTDGSGTILDEYAAKDTRFRVVHQKNVGVSAARNAALDVAMGEWITFVDADDALHSDWLFAVNRGTLCQDVDWVRLGFVYRDYEELPDLQGEEARNASLSVTEGLESKWLAVSESTWLWRNAFRRESVGNCRFPAGLKLCEDGVFLQELIPSVDRICRVDFNGYYYRTRQNSAVRTIYDEDQIQIYLNSAIRIAKSQFSGGRKIPVRYTTFRLEKDMCFHFHLMESGVNQQKMRQIMRCIEELRSLGVFDLCSLSRGYAYAWRLALRTGNPDYLFVNGMMWGIPKLLLYLMTKDRRFLTNTRERITDIFKRKEKI